MDYPDILGQIIATVIGGLILALIVPILPYLREHRRHFLSALLEAFLVILLVIPVVFLVKAILLPDPTKITFVVENPKNYVIQYVFVAADGNLEWPGDERALQIYSGETRQRTLNCQQARKKVCFGAWAQGSRIFWGAGRDGRKHCTDCCRFVMVTPSTFNSSTRF